MRPKRYASRRPGSDVAVEADLDALADPFRAKAERLVATVAREGLPLRVFETRRPFIRTQELFLKGRALVNGVVVVVDKRAVVSNARPGSSPHNWGLAIDLILDPDHDFFEGEQPPTSPWDDGRNNPVVKLAWERYGRCVRQCDLVWGGDWSQFRDWPHAELRQWESLRPTDWKSVALREVQSGR